jgi:enoyl-CoA hydratase/carnithine racemase
MSLRREAQEGGVLLLTFDRPEAANALSRALQESLVAALAEAAADDAVRAVMLAGAGGRVFSAGADLREDLGLPAEEARALRRALLLRSLLAVLDCPKPVVARIRGKAVGGGAMLALLADEVVMAEGAAFAMPEIALGMPSPIGLSIIGARGGRAAAHRLVQANRPMDAAQALDAELADAVHEDAALDAAALARAAALGALPGEAFARNKAWLNAPLRQSIIEAAAAAHGKAIDNAH